MSMDRPEIEALLPFLANETLVGAERETVETAVAGDPQLAAELAALRAIRQQMQTEEMEASPGELGLARLMRDIDREAAPIPVPEASNDTMVPVTRLRLWQVAAAALLAVGVGQAVLTTGGRDDLVTEPVAAAPSMAAETLADDAGDFELAAGRAASPAPAAFRVIFAPDTPEVEMRATLLDAGVEIVAGPSAIGFYDLALLDGEDGRAQALEVLQAAGPMIEIFEELQN